MTSSPDRAGTASWLDANLALVAEFNAARKILTRQLEAASIGAVSIADLCATAVELQTTALLLRALPPVPEPTAALEFEASLVAFEGAVNEILRSAGSGPPANSAAMMMMMMSNAALLMMQSTARYRAATETINEAFASHTGGGLRRPS